MIVKKLWSTRKHKNYGFHFQGQTFDNRYTEWEGIFLFGILPLYIKATKIVYTR